ncbi:MAG TPA: hypothetical protein VIV66_15725 [Pyrinomonadaceae bacterium]
MPQKAKARAATKRTKVKALPKPKRKLSSNEMKKVKGGLITVRKAGEKPVEY